MWEFTGRERELNHLIEAWHKAKSGDPQFVVLLAESGLGKTRLVQEFYRWLARNEDPPQEGAPAGYWPDAFRSGGESLDVNPELRAGVATGTRLPWLWWGLRCTGTDRNQAGEGCALSNHQLSLVPHADKLAATRELKALRQEAAATAGSLLANVVPFAGFLFNLKDLHSLLSARRDERHLLERLDQGPAEAREQHLADLATVALNYFATVLSPSKELPTVPVVIFLDDAHWVDPLTLRFVEDLLRQALPGRWPLLLIATHWEAEWREAADEKNSDEEALHLAAVPRRIDLGSAWEPFQLGPVADMTSVVASTLPGLTGAQQRMLLEKAGGNPLLLQEILLHVLDEPRAFENRDPGRALTASAAQQLGLMKFQLHVLVGRRFKKLDQMVQEALGWSSLQGMRFLTSLTAEVARRVGSTADLEAGFARGEHPHSLVVLEKTSGTLGLGEFRQRVFLDVARDYAEYDAAELKRVNDALRETLIDWALDGTLPRLPADQLEDALTLARRFLEPDASAPQRQWAAWATGIANLDALYERQWRWAEARANALLFADAREEGWPLAMLGLDDQASLVQRLREMREHAAALRLASSLAKEVDTGTKEGTAALAVALKLVGEQELALGRNADALEHFSRSLSIRQRIAAENPEELESLRDLSIALESVGKVESILGQRVEALERFKQSLALRMRFASARDETPDTLRGLSLANERAGDVSFSLGRHDDALAHYRQCLDICERVLATEGETPLGLRNKSVALARVGRLELHLGRRLEAAERFKQSIATDERRMVMSGETPQSLRSLSIGLRKLGDVQLAAGERAEALICFQRSLAIRERLLAEYPETPQALRDLSVALRKVGTIALSLGRHDDALRHFEESLAIRENLVSQHGASREALRDVSIVLRSLGDAEVSRGRLDEALAHYQRSLSIRRSLVAEFGNTSESLGDLGAALGKAGDLELLLDHRADAAGLFQESLATAEQLLMDFGPTPGALRDHGVALMRAGRIALLNGQSNRARALFAQSVAIHKKLVDDYDKTPEALRDLGMALRYAGDTELSEDRRDEALARFDESLALFERVLTECYETPDWLSDLSTALEKAGDVLSMLGRHEEALERFERSLTFREQILARYGETSNALRGLAASLLRAIEIESVTGLESHAHARRQRVVEIERRLRSLIT